MPPRHAIRSGRIAEERRLFYVAVTRARKRVYLFNGPHHHAPTGERFVEPSRFLTEAVKHTLA
ncbi:3'-5' exonuclease [Paraburkholderia sp. BL21I4N1]|uniref:3'-5' exonuclease n=1 Tax=Paraburkholderia sp. BL21I4N1 TaxID=1938801 RepID=UPI0011B21461|nr:3'-5' exonuclease [Paraburkholderia sp. BL21I4N1]